MGSGDGVHGHHSAKKGAVAASRYAAALPGTRDTIRSIRSATVGKFTPCCFRGSAFGLDAACGVMRYLEELGVGRDVKVTCVPKRVRSHPV